MSALAEVNAHLEKLRSEYEVAHARLVYANAGVDLAMKQPISQLADRLRQVIDATS